VTAETRPRALVRARVATAVIFMITGMTFGDWVSRVPEIKDQIHAKSGPLGAALLGIAVGAVLARPWCGRLVAAYGSRIVTRFVTAMCSLALILPALAHNAVELGIALTLFGAMLGSIDIAMNTHAVAVETRYARPIMSSFHGVYSIGGLTGAVLGGRAAALGLSPLRHYTIAGVTFAVIAVTFSFWMLPSTMDIGTGASGRTRGRVRLPQGHRWPLILLGVVGLCSMAGEGAVGDWGAVYLHENVGSSVSVASIGFAVYSLAMVTGRLLGDRFVARYGDWRVITWASAVGGLGFAAALTIGTTVSAIAGFIVLGLGLSLVVPVTFSKAGRLGGDTAGAGVTVVSSVAGLGPIVLPPIIGFLAEALGLPAALGAVSVLALTAVVLMRVIQHLLIAATGPVAPRQREGEPVSLIQPSDPSTLATAVVDSLVVAADGQAREASIFYWDRGLPYTGAVVEAVRALAATDVRDLAERLMADTTNPARYGELHRALVELAKAPDATAEELFRRAWLAESNCRLGIHLGPRYDGGGSAGPVSVDDLRSMPGSTAMTDPADVEVLVVIPFRDRSADRSRLRNLLACLLSLRDQSAPRSRYQVVVVETDTEPRWRDVITPYADHYLFAEKDGLFNKAWTVNVGVVNAPGSAEVVCVLDADVLVDRDFIARNAARFNRPGTMGHLSYRDMWCLDETSTAWAIDQRLRHRTAGIDTDGLRAFVLRRPPGCCVWVRTTAFHRIGGMDERFEGWGGEDNDFAYRMDTNSAFDSYGDLLLHMNHPSSAVLRDDGELINAHIPMLTWRADAEIGDINRFAPGVPSGVGV
jgi:MFS family permease